MVEVAVRLFTETSSVNTIEPEAPLMRTSFPGLGTVSVDQFCGSLQRSVVPLSVQTTWLSSSMTIEIELPVSTNVAIKPSGTEPGFKLMVLSIFGAAE